MTRIPAPLTFFLCPSTLAMDDKKQHIFKCCSLLGRVKKLCLWALWMTAICAVPTTYATQLDLTAEFKPDSGRPDHNKFTNTTPNSGYCVNHPSQCIILNLFSLRAPIQFNSATPINANHSEPRLGAMFSTPTDLKSFTVRHTQTLEEKTVMIRINGIGSRYVTSKSVVELVGGNTSILNAHSMLWSSQWIYAPTPCTYGGTGGGYGATSYSFYWKTPVTGACAKLAKFDIPGLSYPYFDFTYELVTPNPLEMSSGEYTGSINYSIGPYKDFDMGDIMFPNDTSLTLNFTLSVQHTLKIDIPAGGNTVELLPTGGWQQWLQRGRIPEALTRDQTFLISSSSRFKMLLACERAVGDTCAVTNGMGQDVPINVAVSLPSGLTDANGAQVRRRPLLVSGYGTELFLPSRYVDQTPGTLHFEIQKNHIAQMLNQKGTYQGNITVIWDSEI